MQAAYFNCCNCSCGCCCACSQDSTLARTQEGGFKCRRASPVRQWLMLLWHLVVDVTQKTLNSSARCFSSSVSLACSRSPIVSSQEQGWKAARGVRRDAGSRWPCAAGCRAGSGGSSIGKGRNSGGSGGARAGAAERRADGPRLDAAGRVPRNHPGGDVSHSRTPDEYRNGFQMRVHAVVFTRMAREQLASTCTNSRKQTL